MGGWWRGAVVAGTLRTAACAVVGESFVVDVLFSSQKADGKVM